MITQLKLEADTLIAENIRAVEGAQESWAKLEAEEQQKLLEEKKAAIDAVRDEELKKSVLPKIENQKQVGDADSEALGRLQEQLEQYCRDECKRVEERLDAIIKEFKADTALRIENIEQSLSLMNNQNSAFINALKDEVE